jgi:hypothetical protein
MKQKITAKVRNQNINLAQWIKNLTALARATINGRRSCDGREHNAQAKAMWVHEYGDILNYKIFYNIY